MGIEILNCVLYVNLTYKLVFNNIHHLYCYDGRSNITGIKTLKFRHKCYLLYSVKLYTVTTF